MNEVLWEVCSKLFKDALVRFTSIGVLALSLFISAYISLSFGLLLILSFTTGCSLALILIAYKENVGKLLTKFKGIIGYGCKSAKVKADCEICDTMLCQRHKPSTIPREPWKGLFVNADLDSAVESFYSRILNSFVKSWFSLLSHDNDFIQTLKQGLREATCHLIIKIKLIDVSALVTNKLLPILFDHIEEVHRMLSEGIALDKLPAGFVQNDRAIHPAVTNRKAEIDYLRAVAKCLIPRIFHSENFDSKIFFSLVRELIACWVLLPLMDVISDPNLINLMIIHATNKTASKSYRSRNNSVKVEFLRNFVNKDDTKDIKRDDILLKDRNRLYSFMQFLKKEGAVDVLRFYLDVDNLNSELQDPKITTDPAKLSSLYQHSEKLLTDYNNLVNINELKHPTVCSLSEAHENIKASLEGKWRKAFTKTPEYFKLVYGSKEIKYMDDNRNADQTGAVSRLGSKLKDAIRGAIDGAPLDATEVPTVWDALAEPHVPSNPTIYNSVAQKLRKERGQNLDAFLVTFMQSLEQTPDILEDNPSESHKKHRPHAPGRNLVFGNLFGLNRSSKRVQISSSVSFNIKGPSQCLLYIIYKLLKAPLIVVRLVFAFICISQKMADTIICHMIDKIIYLGLFEPRLAVLIRLLENHLFDTKSSEVSPAELLERQRQARKRIENLRSGTGYLADVLQSPALNKHLMYCAFDVILSELYPEFEN